MSNITQNLDKSINYQISKTHYKEAIRMRELQLFDFFNTFYPIFDFKYLFPRLLKKGARDLYEYYLEKDPFLKDFYESYENSLLRDKRGILYDGYDGMPLLTEEILNKHIQMACDYIKNSFENKSYYYTESFLGKLFAKLDFLKIEYTSIGVQEMECCLDILKKRRIELENVDRILDIRDALLRELEDYLNFYEKENLGCVLESKPYDEVQHLMFDISNMISEILLNKSYTMNELNERVQKLEIEINRIEKEIDKEENWSWKVERSDLYKIMPDFLPHNYAKSFINEFIRPNRENIAKILQTDCESILSWQNNGEKLIEMGYEPQYPNIWSPRYPACEIWMTIFEFYDITIRELTTFIDLLKENDEFQKAKDLISAYSSDHNTNEYFNLLNYFVECINDSLEKINVKKNIKNKNCS